MYIYSIYKRFPTGWPTGRNLYKLTGLYTSPLCRSLSTVDKLCMFFTLSVNIRDQIAVKVCLYRVQSRACGRGFNCVSSYRQPQDFGYRSSYVSFGVRPHRLTVIVRLRFGFRPSFGCIVTTFAVRFIVRSCESPESVVKRRSTDLAYKRLT